MRKVFLTTVSAVVLSSSAVLGADMPVKAPPMAAPPPPPWTGFYIGLNAGYVWGNSDPTFIGTGPPFGLGGIAGVPPGLDPNGFIGGVQGGYNWQIGQWVVGGELDFSWMDAKADSSASPFFTGKGNLRTVTWSSRYDWLFTARLRAGYLVAPNWLLYATGGLAVTHLKDSVACIPAPSTCTGAAAGAITWSESTTLTGWTVGGGIETMFARNWTARVEYLYAQFDDTRPPVTSGPPVSPLFNFDHNLNIVRLAVNYKF